MRPTLLIVAAVLLLGNGYAAQPSQAVSANVKTLLQGHFDNREQVDKAPAGADQPIPHVSVTIEPTPQADWMLWHVRIDTDAETSYEQTWAFETRVEHDGSGALVPYYQLKQSATPAAATFDPKDWLSLEACSLRGDFSKGTITGMSEGEPCVAVSMSVGARRALLPVGIEREGEWLHLDMNLRSVRTRIDAKRVP